MLHKTKGVVLNFIRYRETSIISKIYTEQFGLRTYIINGVRSKKPGSRIAFFQPLTLLDLVVYHNEKREINRISEIRCSKPYSGIPFDPIKTSIAIFLNEILARTLKEEVPNQELFDFISLSFSWFDDAESSFSNFHLQFLLKYAGLLGYYPAASEDIYHGLNQDETQLLEALIQQRYDSQIILNAGMRRRLLDVILRFYAAHIDNFGEMRSLKILQEIM
ncbi:DNA repair protein RecO [Cytophagaceae bacterium ABcell3]|nr:DNA repair protein RecO [Cytophagaceae bacterium ABcell3]